MGSGRKRGKAGDREGALGALSTPRTSVEEWCWEEGQSTLSWRGRRRGPEAYQLRLPTPTAPPNCPTAWAMTHSSLALVVGLQEVRGEGLWAGSPGQSPTVTRAAPAPSLVGPSLTPDCLVSLGCPAHESSGGGSTLGSQSSIPFLGDSGWWPSDQAGPWPLSGHPCDESSPSMAPTLWDSLAC